MDQRSGDSLRHHCPAMRNRPAGRRRRNRHTGRRDIHETETPADAVRGSGRGIPCPCRAPDAEFVPESARRSPHHGRKCGSRYRGCSRHSSHRASLPAALSGLTVAGAAFAGALLTSALVTVVASRLHDAPTLLVFGVMLGFVFSAVTAILEYSANAESLKVFYSWSAGSFSGNTLPQAGIMAVAAAVGLALAAMNSSGLDAALFGDDYSAMTGVPIRRVRIVSVIGSCLMAGTVTAFCGPLGFVGIVAPHIARRLAGTSVHWKVIPATMACGASIALAADILSQVFPTPLPVGSTMALIGIPVILAILLKRQAV